MKLDMLAVESRTVHPRAGGMRGVGASGTGQEIKS